MITTKETRVNSNKLKEITTDPRLIKNTIVSTYANPFYAVMREYAANAFDANRNPEQPNIITFSEANELLGIPASVTFRDFGSGMSKSFLRNEFLKAGYSTKDTNDNDVGGWGIGRLAGFTIADSVAFNSYYNGKKLSFSLEISKDAYGQTAIKTTNTNEPNGLEVIIYLANNALLTKLESYVPFLFMLNVKIVGSKMELIKPVYQNNDYLVASNRIKYIYNHVCFLRDESYAKYDNIVPILKEAKVALNREACEFDGNELNEIIEKCKVDYLTHLVKDCNDLSEVPDDFFDFGGFYKFLNERSYHSFSASFRHKLPFSYNKWVIFKSGSLSDYPYRYDGCETNVPKIKELMEKWAAKLPIIDDKPIRVKGSCNDYMVWEWKHLYGREYELACSKTSDLDGRQVVYAPKTKMKREFLNFDKYQFINNYNLKQLENDYITVEKFLEIEKFNIECMYAAYKLTHKLDLLFELEKSMKGYEFPNLVKYKHKLEHYFSETYINPDLDLEIEEMIVKFDAYLGIEVGDRREGKEKFRNLVLADVEAIYNSLINKITK